MLTMTVSILLSLVVYAWAFGWQFAIGFIILLAVHELGHLLASKVVGLSASKPMFLPFIGAVINLRQPPVNAKMEANVAIGGPAAGTLSALLCLTVYLWTNSGFMLILTLTGCVMNLFNLIPLLPLDGGRIAGAISPRMWLLGDIILAILSVYTQNIFLFATFIISLYQLWQGGGNFVGSEQENYYSLPPRQRLRVAWWYFGLLAVLGITTLFVIKLLSY